MKLVILESPYAGLDSKSEGQIEKNVEYSRACLRDSLMRNESPLASHLLYTQPNVLDDTDPDERAIGIEAGLAWGKHAHATVVYVDRGFSRGMEQGVRRAIREGRPVHVRRILK
jgi:hypothetical protein